MTEMLCMSMIQAGMGLVQVRLIRFFMLRPQVLQRIITTPFSHIMKVMRILQCSAKRT